ncbi:hypothetical protein [Hymenobacter amundsenii]
MRRNPVRQNLMLRHRVAQATRRFLDGQEFVVEESLLLHWITVVTKW